MAIRDGPRLLVQSESDVDSYTLHSQRTFRSNGWFPYFTRMVFRLLDF